MNKKTKEKEAETSGWAFAIVNRKLSEIFFKVRNGKMSVYAHCYVEESEYKAKWEKKAIQNDTEKYRFIWRNKEYKRVQPKTI
ncbi:MAG: hypothetical protein UY07_C0006G0041 [Parcubacteria group bacterium GW2011_GWA1_47_8]|nr:MAG: hypothetical protein UY07_C0006G0041 [Parcubacteria group bacterium GW2011_GWA1_47_8]